MMWLLVHGNMLTAYFRLVHDDCTKCTLHVTGVGAWGLDTKYTICMLQVHCNMQSSIPVMIVPFAQLHVMGVST